MDPWEMHPSSHEIHHCSIPSLPSPFCFRYSTRSRRTNPCHFYSSDLATTDLVYLPHFHDGMPSDISPCDSMIPFTGCTPHSTVGPTEIMAPPWFWNSEITCSEAVKQVHLNSRHDMTRCSYLHKWTRLQSWCASNQIEAISAPLSLILDYILHLKQSGLSMSSICVHLAAITIFHYEIDGHFVFTHPLKK